MAAEVMDSQASSTREPAIDVIIPTLDSESNLIDCIQAIRSQTYRGEIRITVIDGGSVDNTRESAEGLGAQVYCNPGQYATGLTGSRHFGELRTDAPLVWFLDSDNILSNCDAALKLALPLIDNPDLDLSVPWPDSSRSLPSFSRWLSLLEEHRLSDLLRSSTPHGTWYSTEDLTFGICNASLIRRSALSEVVGYDSDVRVLTRLRRIQRSKAALVPEVKFVHRQADSIEHFLRKNIARTRMFARMSELDLSSYFVEYPPSASSHTDRVRLIVGSVLEFPLTSLKAFASSRDTTWLWGLLWPFLITAMFLAAPLSMIRVARRFV